MRAYDAQGNERYISPKAGRGLQSILAGETFQQADITYADVQVRFELLLTNNGNVNATFTPINKTITANEQTKKFNFEDETPKFLEPQQTTIYRTEFIDVSWATGTYELTTIFEGSSEQAETATKQVSITFTRAEEQYTCQENTCNGEPISEENGCTIWQTTRKEHCKVATYFKFHLWKKYLVDEHDLCRDEPRLSYISKCSLDNKIKEDYFDRRSQACFTGTYEKEIICGGRI